MCLRLNGFIQIPVAHKDIKERDTAEAHSCRRKPKEKKSLPASFEVEPNCIMEEFASAVCVCLSKTLNLFASAPSNFNGRPRTFQLTLALVLSIGLSVAQAAETPGGTSDGSTSMSAWSTLSTTTRSATPVQINMLECMNAFDTQAQAVLVCYNYPDLFAVLKFAEQVGRDECQKTFQGERWNCSTFGILKAPIVTKKDIMETAYIRALQVAVIAHTVAKACRTGTLVSCGCAQFNTNTLTQVSGNSYSGNCSDNFEFGYQFAQNFTSNSITSNTVPAKADRHNFDAGIIAMKDIMASTPPNCKCMGFSGSCTTQVCWQEAPEFSVVGSSIKKLYNSALRVTWNSYLGTNTNWIAGGQPVSDKTLIYGSDSPNWCEPDPSVGSTGVLGRRCDLNSNGPNQCSNLCCDHGYEQTQLVQDTDCNCKFVYCCNIQCSKCHTVTTTYTCK